MLVTEQVFMPIRLLSALALYGLIEQLFMRACAEVAVAWQKMADC